MTALARFTIRATALQNPDPSAVLAALNDAVLLDESVNERFLSVVYATLSVRDDGIDVTVASGGHPRPLVARRAGGAQPVDVTGPLVGIDEDVHFEASFLHLEVGDVMVLYTDGLTDAAAPQRIVGEDELARLLGAYPGESAQDVADRLQAFASGSGQPRDDVALVVVEAAHTTPRTGTAGRRQNGSSRAQPDAAPREQVRALDADPASLSLGRRLAREAAAERMHDDQLAKLDLAVTEVLSNAIRHSGSTEPVRLALTAKEDFLCVRVTDHGAGLVPRPGAMASEPGAGFGLLLVEQLTRRWGMTREENATRIWFEIDYEPAAAPAKPVAALFDAV